MCVLYFDVWSQEEKNICHASSASFTTRFLLLSYSCTASFKANESRYEHYRVIPHLSPGQNLLKKTFRKDKY